MALINNGNLNNNSNIQMITNMMLLMTNKKIQINKIMTIKNNFMQHRIKTIMKKTLIN